MTEPLFAHREKKKKKTKKASLVWIQYSYQTIAVSSPHLVHLLGFSSRGFGTHLREKWHQRQRVTQHCEGLRINHLGFCPWSLQPSPGRRGELTAKPAVAEVLLWHWGAQQVLLVIGQPRAAGTAGLCSCPTDCPGPGRTEGRTSRQLGMDGVLALQGCPAELHSPGPRKRPWGTRQQHPEPMRG